MTQKYQVLARKYRPQKFADLIGQEAVVTTLKNAIRFCKIAHAYLFSGSRGVGKTTLARLFAKALNCQQIGPDQEPCNSCSSCLDIMAGQSLDVIEIDGASNRGIDDMRQINETVGYAPSQGHYKIYIIDEVHMLTKEAFNALLKTLEEPPERAKFFFATTEPHKILPTIISRCQRFDLGRILPSQIIGKLEQIAKDLHRNVEPEALHQIAILSDGSLRDAESLFDQILCFLDGTVTAASVRQVFGLVAEEHFFALDKAFSENRIAYAFELVDHLFQSGKDLAHFLSQLIEHYRLITICKTLGSEALPPSLAARYMQSATLYIPSQILYILEYLLKAESDLQKSLSGRVFLEATLLHIIRSKNRIPIEVLIRRLTELEGAICASAPPQNTQPQQLLQNSKEEAKPQIKSPQSPPPQTKSFTTQIEEIHTTPIHEHSDKKPQKDLLQTPPTPLEPITTTPPLEKTQVPKGSVQKEEPIAKLSHQSPEENLATNLSEKTTPTKHPSHYDTLLRFAAVELEGSVKI